MAEKASMWELLWDYDPNGLVVVDLDLKIVATNDSFCRFFDLDETAIMQKNVREILSNGDDFVQVWDSQEAIKGKESHYPEHELFVRKLIFPIPEEELIACIVVDLSQEEAQRQELKQLKQLSLDKVEQVIHKQMKTAQEIAGLLGETTAETKASLLQVKALLNEDF